MKKPGEKGGGNALTRLRGGSLVGGRRARGALGGLVRRGPSVLSPAAQASVTALQGRAEQALGARLETMLSGAVAVEIGSDFSASTSGIHTMLLEISSALATKLSASAPLARISYGVFGGGGLIETDSGSKVMEQSHQGTGGWESSFADYLDQYAASPDPVRQDVLVSLHDARPNLQDPKLHAAIRTLNEHPANPITFILYVPTSGGEEDKQALKDVADQLTNGIFIDLTGVDATDPSVMEQFMHDLTVAVMETNKEAARSSEGDAAIASTTARARLRDRVGGLIGKARQLSGSPKLLTDDL
jgi:hypothetical protein